jgi:hypothetical protein
MSNFYPQEDAKSHFSKPLDHLPAEIIVSDSCHHHGASAQRARLISEIRRGTAQLRPRG